MSDEIPGSVVLVELEKSCEHECKERNFNFPICIKCQAATVIKQLQVQAREATYYKFKMDLLSKEYARAMADLWAVQRELCEFMVDSKRNLAPFYGLPQEYAELREWICYFPTGAPRTSPGSEPARQEPEP